MDKSTSNPEPEEPDDLEIEREVAEEQDAKYGGHDRWPYTFAFFILAALAVWGASRKELLTILWVAFGIYSGVIAAINWYRWGEKSPAEKAAQPASNVLKPLKIVGHPAPFTEDEFLQARSTLGLSLAACAFLCLFALMGLVDAFLPHRGLVEPLVAGTIGITTGWLGLICGKRASQQARFLSCPGCKDLLSSQTRSVLRTGHCRKCGAVVLSGQPEASPEPDDVEKPQPAAARAHGVTRRSSFLSRDFKHDRGRLWDVVVLFGCPAVCVLLSRGVDGLSLFSAVAAIGYGGMFYFDPSLTRDEDSESDRHPKHPAQPKRTAAPDARDAGSGAAAGADKTPWLDFGMILSVPVAVVMWLLYLVWTNTVLGKLGLSVATVAIPAAVVLVSWFVVRHEGHQVKKTGKPAPMALMGGLLASWIAAVFIFVVCLVSLIEKYGLQW